jgi:small subunit ribosomal protein S1
MLRAAMSNDDDFEAMLAEFDGRKDPQVGDRITGTIVSIGRDAVFVDLGAKSEGTLDLEQVMDEDGNVLVEVGQAIEATVLKKDDRAGSLVLRTRMTRSHRGLEELEQAFANELPVEGVVSATNKGGFEVQIGGLRAFCPVSQIDSKFVEDTEQFVGQRFSFRITKIEGGKRPNIVVSRRAILEEENRERAAQTRETLEVGAVLRGVVSSIKDYGAFIDIGGLEGMVHISELAFGRVNHPSDVLAPGQELEVVVLRIEKTGDPRRPEKIALSVRALDADPWQDAGDRFAPGTRIAGTVVRVQPFGAFVELAPGVEGLVHISELGAGRRVNHPREVVKVGDKVEATVLRVELDKRRIALSLAAAGQEDAAREETEAVASYNNPTQSLGTLGDLLKKK